MHVHFHRPPPELAPGKLGTLSPLGPNLDSGLEIKHDPCWGMVARVFLLTRPPVNTAAYEAVRQIRRKQKVIESHAFDFSEFREVAVLLKREAGVTHEQLHERFAAYERGEEIRFPLTLESDEVITTLGFDPKAA